ncbi:hypothetical protein BK778_16410 [Bacillus thuringiensis serovar aizawai]|nr:hypothetical protein BK756_02710 [Bacillus thuringiensis serovar aizawai]OUA45856.1 hypothetical protein BK778_16410 [Bacillus thuringiensis serovar aizawai]
MKTKDYKEKCMNKFNEIRLLLCGHIHKVRALYFLFIFHFSLDFSRRGNKDSDTSFFQGVFSC